MKIGVISDTHYHLDSRVEKIFKGVDHILHAGDIGDPIIELELRNIAPTTAVVGNIDAYLDFPLTAVRTLDGKKFLVHHIVNPHLPSSELSNAIAKEKPDAVIFGHTHKAFAEIVGNIFFFNPGYAGKPKPGAERSVGILRIEAGKIQHEFISL